MEKLNRAQGPLKLENLNVKNKEKERKYSRRNNLEINKEK